MPLCPLRHISRYICNLDLYDYCSHAMKPGEIYRDVSVLAASVLASAGTVLSWPHSSDISIYLSIIINKT